MPPSLSHSILAEYRTSLALGILAILTIAIVVVNFVPRVLSAPRSVSPIESTFNQEPTPSPSPCCGSADNKPHLLMGSYYTLRENQSAKLLLNNKGSLPLVAHPRLFSMSGQRFDVAPVTIAPESFQMINLADWAQAAGPEFNEGSIQVFHLGRDLVLGSQIYLVDEVHSLSFDEKLVEKGGFKSAKLEGLWWLPSPVGEVRLALSNTSESPLTVSVNADGKAPNRSGDQSVYLNRHETRLLDIQADVFHHPNGAMSRLGGISIQHSGAPGALLARGMAQEAAKGYSLAIQFGDPTTGKSAKLQGAGFRVGKAGSESLTPIVIARNVGNATTTVTGRFRYTTINGGEGTITLPQIVLSPGELDDVDVARAVWEHGNQSLQATGSLEFEYSTAAGSVTMTALSIGESGTQVFRVPMWDVYAQKSPTGGYPWRLEGSSSTIVYIKNAEEYSQHYYFQLRYPGGIYSLGIKSIEAGQTVQYDLRRLRDEQVPDVNGIVIPLTESSGQVHWSKTGHEAGMLIGRSEQFDLGSGISSNYACANCCPDNGANPRVRQNTSCAVGESRMFISEQQLTTCYGTFSGYMEVFGATWSSNNETVATATAGTAFANAPGSAQIKAAWDSTHYTYVDIAPEGGGGIEPFGGQFSCEATGTDHLQATATLTVTPAVGSLQASVPSTKNPATGTRPDPGLFSSTSPSDLFATTSTTAADMMTVLQTSDALITVTAQDVNPSSFTNQLKWKIDRDPTDTVATGTPTLSAQAGSPITVTPNTPGNFRLICYYDKSGNGAYNAGEEIRVIRLAVVRVNVQSGATIDNPGVSFQGSPFGSTEYGVQSQQDIMVLECTIVLEGGGANKLIGVDKIKIGTIQNLVSSTGNLFTISYPIPNPTPAAPGNVSGTGTENPGGQIPTVDSGEDPSGGVSVFLSGDSGGLTGSNLSGGGQERTLTTYDNPGFGPWLLSHLHTHNPWMSTQGGYDFKNYISAFSESFPRYYAVLARGEWTVRVIGNKSNGAWVNNGSTVTLPGGSGGSAPLTILVTNGSPTSGDTAGVQVLGNSFSLHHSISYSP